MIFRNKKCRIYAVCGVSQTSNGYIQKEVDGEDEWFDLKTDKGTPCMDGETCEILQETEDYVLLQEEREQIPFKLSRKEFEIATVECQ